MPASGSVPWLCLGSGRSSASSSRCFRRPPPTTRAGRSASKRKAAGKKANAKLKRVAMRRHRRRTLPVDPTGITKAEDKFDLAFTKLPADKGGCLATNDTATIEASVDVCVGRIRTQLGIAGDPASRSLCSSSEPKATGKKLFRKTELLRQGREEARAGRPGVSLEDRDEVSRPPSRKAPSLRGRLLGTAAATPPYGRVDRRRPRWPVGLKRCRCRSRSRVPCREPGSFAGITAQHNDTRARTRARPRAPRSIPCAAESYLLARRAQAWANRLRLPATTRTSAISDARGRTSTPSRAPGLPRRIPRWMPSRPGAAVGRRLRLLDQYLRSRHPRSAGTKHADRLA